MGLLSRIYRLNIININRLTFVLTHDRIKMVKRKGSTGQKSGCAVLGAVHSLSPEDVSTLRQDLLEWYGVHQRELPWRTIAREEKDVNKRIYSVWVSEVMLQQTQVATVIDYYNKWITKWPTIEDLSKATLEEVNEMWSGLGYYSRGRRLHEGAIKVMSEFAGILPRSSEELMKHLPGVGRYTAGAIASISLGQSTGVVDGNVSRVFSRLRIIGADITNQTTIDAIWALANSSVDSDRPGDFNQALMELGATVCTPRAPQCASCPVQSLCKAYKQVEQEKKRTSAKLLKSSNSEQTTPTVVDIECAEEACKLCFSPEDHWEGSNGVTNYPRKGKKKAPREEKTCVCVFRRSRDGSSEGEYLLVQRPETGLLANLWEFPSVPVLLDSTSSQAQDVMSKHLQEQFDLTLEDIDKRQFVTEVVHIFSHIHQTYMVETASLSAETKIETSSCASSTKWVTAVELDSTAISTAMKKVFKAVISHQKGKTTSKQSKTKGTSDKSPDGKKQLGLHSFFTKVS